MKQIYKELLAKLAYEEIAEAIRCDYYASPEELCNAAEVMDWIKRSKPYSHHQITTNLTEAEIDGTIFLVLDMAKFIYF